MKKLILNIIILGFVSYSFASELKSSWLEIKLNDDESYFYDIEKANEIRPYVYKIPRIKRESEYKADYFKKIITKLTPYCQMPEGIYPETEDLMLEGEQPNYQRHPDIQEIYLKKYLIDNPDKKNDLDNMTKLAYESEVFDMHIKVAKSIVVFNVPVFKFNTSGEFVEVIFCSDENGKNDNVEKMIRYNIESQFSENINFEYIDCMNRRSGFMLSDGVYNPAFMMEFDEGMIGLQIIDEVCAKLNL